MPYLHIDMTQAAEIFPRERTALFHITNIMAADDLTMQEARASAAITLN